MWQEAQAQCIRCLELCALAWGFCGGGNSFYAASAIFARSWAIGMGRCAATRRAWRSWNDWETIGNRAVALNNLGNICYQRGKWSAALDYYDSSLKGFERSGDVGSEGVSLEQRGQHLLQDR